MMKQDHTVVDSSRILLSSINRILKHQQEIKILKGENFNVFSILKMESKENETHSAFLAELLNPKGSHLLNTRFLSLFLDEISYTGDLNITTARLTTEDFIGNRNDKEKTGGRIDIYIQDSSGNSISIENKIYAADQDTQIERYVNHNRKKNTVYYLTLNGEEASKASRGQLEEGIDYYCISYQDTIIDWLKLCLKEASELPILRESIKQYIILIKKLTNQLTDSKMEKEILDLIEKNYAAAKIIEGNIWKIELKTVYNLLNELKDKLKIKLGEYWNVELDDDLSVNWSGLTLAHASWDGIKIKLEGQPIMTKHRTVYGIHAPKHMYNRSEIRTRLDDTDLFNETFKESNFWPYYKTIYSLASQSEKDKLFDKEKRAAFIEDKIHKLLEMAEVCKDRLKDIPKY